MLEKTDSYKADGAVKARTITGTMDALGEQEAVLAGLDETVDKLASLLMPVLMPDATQDAKNAAGLEPAPPLSSILTSRIRNNTEGLRAINHRLHNLIDRAGAAL